MGRRAVKFPGAPYRHTIGVGGGSDEKLSVCVSGETNHSTRDERRNGRFTGGVAPAAVGLWPPWQSKDLIFVARDMRRTRNSVTFSVNSLSFKGRVPISAPRGTRDAGAELLCPPER
jgi:hypothetical protein